MGKSRGIAGASDRHVNRVVEFFDQRANDYAREYHDETPGGYALRVRRRKVLELFDQHGGKVLDLGCGPGPMAEELVDRGCEFWGVDPSSKMLEIGRRRFQDHDRIHFLDGEATRVGLPDGFFDAVICMGVMDALGDRRAALREMLRLLKPGGTLIVTFANLCSPYVWWKNYVFYPAVWRWHAMRTRARVSKLGGRERALYSRRAARQLVQSAGAEVVQTVTNYYNVFLSPLDEVMPSAALWVAKKLEDQIWPRPEWIAASLIVKARKI